MLATIGIPLEWDYYRDRCIGLPDDAMLRMMAGECDPPRDVGDLWQLYPAKQKLFQQKTLGAPPFAPELAGLLERLHQEYKMAVVTACIREEIEPLLKAGGLRGYFDSMVCAGEAARHKPAPDPYLLAAERLGARTALVLEDSEAGMASGRAAGFEVLQIRNPKEMPRQLLNRLGLE